MGIHPDIPEDPKEELDTPAEPKDRQNDQDTPDNLYAGKYRNVQEFERGYWETAQEGLKQRDRALAAEREAERLQQELEAARGRRQDEETEEPLAEAGLPVAALDARIEQRALKLMQDTLGPLVQANSAEQKLAQSHPDFPGMAQVQKALPPELAESYNKLLSTDPEAAMSMAYAVYEAKQKEPKVAEPSVDPAKRRDAGTATAAKTRSADSDDAGFSKEKYAELFESARQTGDWSDFLRYRFGTQDWFKHMNDRTQ